MNNITIKLITLGTYVVAFGIFMLYQRVQHKKRMKAIDDRRWIERWRELEEERRRMEECLRRSAMVPDDEVKATDKLSPQKKIKSHKLVERKYTIYRPGVYTREVDVSVWVPVNNENDLDEL